MLIQDTRRANCNAKPILPDGPSTRVYKWNWTMFLRPSVRHHFEGDHYQVRLHNIYHPASSEYTEVLNFMMCQISVK